MSKREDGCYCPTCRREQGDPYESVPGRSEDPLLCKHVSTISRVLDDNNKPAGWVCDDCDHVMLVQEAPRVPADPPAAQSADAQRTPDTAPAPEPRQFIFRECAGMQENAAVFVYPDAGKEGIWVCYVREAAKQPEPPVSARIEGLPEGMRIVRLLPKYGNDGNGNKVPLVLTMEAELDYDR